MTDSGFNSDEEQISKMMIESLQVAFETKDIEITAIENINNEFDEMKITVINIDKKKLEKEKTKKEKTLIIDKIEECIYEKQNDNAEIYFEMLGWLNTTVKIVKNGKKIDQIKVGDFLTYQQKKEKICKASKDMFSLHSEHFYRFIHAYFQDDFIFDHANKTWYYTDNGKWNNHKNGNENFILSKRIKKEISYLYENETKTIERALEKLIKELTKDGTPYRVEPGCIRRNEYVPARLFIKNGEKDAEIKNIENIKHFKAYLELDRRCQVCKYYYNKCLDSDKFIPNAIKALREHFSMANIDEKFDNNPYMLAFNNCYIDLLHTIETKKITPLPHTHRNFTAMSARYNLQYEENLKEAIEILNYNVGRCFTTEEKFKTMLKSKAYSLFGENPMKKIFINFGKSGNNGKGLTDSLMEISLGDYYSCISSDFIIDGKNSFDAERPQPSLCASMKCRYLSMSEMEEGAKLSGKTVKSIRGGNALSVRTLHSERKKLIPQFTPHLDTNHCPEFGNGGKALNDSIFMISWDVSFEEKSEKFIEETETKKFSNDIKSIIYDDNELYGNAWIWILLRNLESTFENHKDFEELKQEETESTNYIKQYYEDEIKDTESDDTETEFEFLQIKTLYEHATFYFRRQNIAIPNRKKFKEEFDKFIPENRRIEKKNPINIKVKGTDKKKSVRNYYKSYQFNSLID